MIREFQLIQSSLVPLPNSSAQEVMESFFTSLSNKEEIASIPCSLYSSFLNWFRYNYPNDILWIDYV